MPRTVVCSTHALLQDVTDFLERFPTDSFQPKKKKMYSIPIMVASLLPDVTRTKVETAPRKTTRTEKTKKIDVMTHFRG